jgi:hypothetical protein
MYYYLGMAYAYLVLSGSMRSDQMALRSDDDEGRLERPLLISESKLGDQEINTAGSYLDLTLHSIDRSAARELNACNAMLDR